jgi:hypothetical protein
MECALLASLTSTVAQFSTVLYSYFYTVGSFGDHVVHHHNRTDSGDVSFRQIPPTFSRSTVEEVIAAVDCQQQHEQRR